jgi:hypothetical protein
LDIAIHQDQRLPESLMADEQIAPLVTAAITHGCIPRHHCQGEEKKQQLAFMTFPNPQEGLEFLLQTAHLMDYRTGDQLGLTVLRPLTPDGKPGAKVIWHPRSTNALITAWKTQEG